MMWAPGFNAEEEHMENNLTVAIMRKCGILGILINQRHAAKTQPTQLWWLKGKICDGGVQKPCVCLLSFVIISVTDIKLPTLLSQNETEDRCFSRMLTCSHPDCTIWHTQDRSLSDATGHAKGKPGQISLSSDISLVLLAGGGRGGGHFMTSLM